MHQLYVLFEHASGYALFRTREFEEVAVFLPQVQNSILDVSKFRGVVYFMAFQSFRSGSQALENAKSLMNGVLSSDLQLFLENNVPKSKKSKQPIVLGVQDPKLATAISETLGIKCTTSIAVLEISRGIRFHFHKLVKGFKDLSAVQRSELRLGHEYSRYQVKYSFTKSTESFISTMSLNDALEKDINTLVTRLRKWYSFHFPELSKIVPQNVSFVKCCKIIKNRKDMREDIEEQLQNVLMDSDKVQEILDAAHCSMGMEVAACDIENIENLADRILSLIKRHQDLAEYVKFKTRKVAPNTASLMGENITARLITQAGSLTNLAKMPASTVQILGADKALFRAVKRKGSTLKYGLIQVSPFIGKADKINKGRLSTFLANKCSLAARADCFSEIPPDGFGCELKKLVEDRFNFYERTSFKDLKMNNSSIKKKETKSKQTSKEKENALEVDVIAEQNLIAENQSKNQTLNSEDIDFEKEQTGDNAKKKSKIVKKGFAEQNLTENSPDGENLTASRILKKRKIAKSDLKSSLEVTKLKKKKVIAIEENGISKKKKKKQAVVEENTEYLEVPKLKKKKVITIKENGISKKKKKKQAVVEENTE
ncbi:nucleolar protein 56-like isoform X2 [Stegodyphus dumicola]|uniref:nucleolar protein 56-like isoform X2 n=1 Tax=Stegodyphus dumicola TaxID=202533 RepID=UPI0015B280A0|nr:nucleolar protein 56-like isoform X2 [Stegodyphus dumicola]